MPHSDTSAVTVTSCEPPFSDTEPGERDNLAPYHHSAVTSSLSVSSNEVPVTLRPEALPEIEIVSFPSTSVSSIGVSLNAPVPAVPPAGISRASSATAV